jgi:hypothetical protein
MRSGPAQVRPGPGRAGGLGSPILSPRRVRFGGQADRQPHIMMAARPGYSARAQSLRRPGGGGGGARAG